MSAASNAADRRRGTPPRANYLEAGGAYQLRFEIEEYWRQRGSKKINVWVESLSKSDPDTYIIKSNLRNAALVRRLRMLARSRRQGAAHVPRKVC